MKSLYDSHVSTFTTIYIHMQKYSCFPWLRLLVGINWIRCYRAQISKGVVGRYINIRVRAFDRYLLRPTLPHRLHLRGFSSIGYWTGKASVVPYQRLLITILSKNKKVGRTKARCTHRSECVDRRIRCHACLFGIMANSESKPWRIRFVLWVHVSPWTWHSCMRERYWT